MKAGWLFTVVGLLTWSLSLHATAREPKEWAFLIFLNGHNNLSDYGDLNINQLETIGSTKDVDVVVQWGKWGAKDTVRLHVEKDSDPKKVTSPVIQTLPRQDMGDWKGLVEFVKWSAEKYPAKRYFVAFWNHGSGWHKSKNPLTRGVSYDDYSNNHITTEQMGLAMKEIHATIGHKVDIVGADACLMAMAEVASEMADNAEFYVASEELEPALGWPYDKFLARWAANPTAPTAEIAGILVDEYYRYMNGKNEVTLSAFDLRQSQDLWDAMKALSASIQGLTSAELKALNAATKTAQAFYYKDYVDLGNWIRKALTARGVALPRDVLGAVGDAVGRYVTANKTTASYSAAEGVAFWVPNSKTNYDTHHARYLGLRFHKETGWGEAVTRLVTTPRCGLHKGGQFATGVLSYSSQWGSSSWSAAKATGACDTDAFGDSRNAWAPSRSGRGLEYIALKYATPVRAHGAVVRMNLGPGAVRRVEAIDAQGAHHVVWEGNDPSPAGRIADFLVTWEQTEYLVTGLKVTIDTKHSSGWEEIDSVQLIGTP